MGDLLKGKNIVIMGVRNKWSIAWGIVKSAADEGANIIFTYQGEREEKEASSLASQIDNSFIYKCDISSDKDIDALFKTLKNEHGVIHGLVHAIAHANSEDIHNNFINTSREGFAHALDISAYSLVAVSKRAAELMTEGGSIVTLTYMGSERVFSGYNVMGVAKAALEACVRYLANDLGPLGIRINAISAGAIKTISSKAIKDFGNILGVVEQRAPLRRGIDQNELGDSALFLLSDLSRAITGEIIHVDCGFNIMGI
ncbi:MAG TPA: enoyl-ACP reductase [Clostridiales bacterium]|nr:enoyl-ACP reductase [Clostridiales bacterium]